MSTTTSEQGRSAEPRLVLPFLAGFYGRISELSWPIIRLAVGAPLLVHGWGKLMTFTTNAGIGSLAASLARRGLEPSVPLAYVVLFNETIGAVCIMLGLFTRLVAASIAIEFAVITFVAHFKNGYGWTSPGGGWEFPLIWGTIFFAVALRGGGPYSLDRKLGWEL
jgi:putative oxidoreductase